MWIKIIYAVATMILDAAINMSGYQNKPLSIALIIIALLLFGWAAISYWRKKLHTGINFQRSSVPVQTHETQAGSFMTVHEIGRSRGPVTPATATTVFTAKDGKEYIVRQEVHKEDGSTKIIQLPEQ